MRANFAPLCLRPGLLMAFATFLFYGRKDLPTFLPVEKNAETFSKQNLVVIGRISSIFAQKYSGTIRPDWDSIQIQARDWIEPFQNGFLLEGWKC